MKPDAEKKPKPIKEHLSHFDIAGFTYYDGPEAFENLKIGTKLQLIPDAENKFDARAIAIYHNDLKLGFVPRSENRIIYKLLKIGFQGLEIKIQRIDSTAHPENQIGVIVHLLESLKP